MSERRDYWELTGFEQLYLEDSWITAIQIDTDSVRIDADIVLRENHPSYTSPLPGEKYCYRSGVICFQNVSSVDWRGRGAPAAVDASGERDFGSFDEFHVLNKNQYVLSGDFGKLVVDCSAPVVWFTGKSS